MKKMLCQTAVSFCLVISSIQAFAKGPAYHCAIDSEVIEFNLNQKGMTKTGQKVSMGRFSVDQIADVSLAHKLDVRLALVETGDAAQLFLTVNSGAVQIKKVNDGRDLTDLVQLDVKMKDRSRQTISVQCESLDKFQIDFGITEGKIEASMADMN